MANNPFPELQQTNISGTKWLRAKRAVIEIPVDGDASVNFVLEQAINLDGEIITKDAGNLILPLTSGNIYQLIDAESGLPIENQTASDDQIGQFLYSKFINAQMQQQ